MTKLALPKYAAVFMCIAMGGFAACSSTPDPNFFLLQTTQGHNAEVATASPDDVIIIGPVTLPEHLSRREIISHHAPFQIAVAEFDRWAEPLDAGISIVLTENLSAIFGSEKVLDYYANLAISADYAVRVRVLEFGAHDGDRVLLSAQWSVHDKTGKQIALRKTQYESPIMASEDKTALVAVMSGLLGQMSQDIAGEISNAG